MILKNTVKYIVGGSALALLLLVNSVARAGQASAPLTGAIFTTLIDGTAVNHNIYTAKEEVYLNGGPQPNRKCDAAGLPDGLYYFQVTDPSGKELLSRLPGPGDPVDPIENRKVEVKYGVFTPSVNIAVHGVAQDDPNIPIGKCGGYTVQLSPFNSTPNPGGEYKVWITRVDDYDKTGMLGSFGFIPSKSKTDNFKVIGIDSDDDGDGGQCPEDPDACVFG